MSTHLFTAWFRQQLKRRTWNQSVFSRESGVPKTTVSSWFRGRSIPDPAQCRTIADTFDMDADYVLDKAGHRPGITDNGEMDSLKAELHALIDGHPLPITEDLIEAVRGLLTYDLRTRK